MNILVVGLGNIGIRHIESIISQKSIKKIFVYDSDIKKTKKIKNIFNKYQQKIIPMKKLKTNKVDFFLCIISTPANGRYFLFKKINKIFKIKFWLFEKILFNNINHVKLFRKKYLKRNMFVNLPLQLMRPFSIIKYELKNISIDRSFYFELIGGNWNMASNSLHFIQLVKWLTSVSVKKIEIKNPIKFYESKRKNYKEFNNDIEILYQNNIRLHLHCRTMNKKTFIVKKNKKITFIYDFIKNRLSTFNKKNFLVRCEFQSQLTKLIYKKLLFQNYDDLVFVEDHIKDNLLFLNAINKKKKSNFFQIT